MPTARRCSAGQGAPHPRDRHARHPVLGQHQVRCISVGPAPVRQGRRRFAQVLAYYIDSFWLSRPNHIALSCCTLTNHDFFIANKAFFCDLSMWTDETPVDEPGQPLGADVRTLQAILRSTHDRSHGKVFSMGGFVPWAWKYTKPRRPLQARTRSQ